MMCAIAVQYAINRVFLAYTAHCITTAHVHAFLSFLVVMVHARTGRSIIQLARRAHSNVCVIQVSMENIMRKVSTILLKSQVFEVYSLFISSFQDMLTFESNALYTRCSLNAPLAISATLSYKQRNGRIHDQVWRSWQLQLQYRTYSKIISISPTAYTTVLVCLTSFAGARIVIP